MNIASKHVNRAAVWRLSIGAQLLLMACGAEALPDGPYLRSEFSGGHLSNVIFVFKSGQAAMGAGGDLEKFDFAAHKARNPKNAGTYTRSGDTLKISWGDGTAWEGKIKPDKAGGFDYRSSGYAPVKRLEKGAVLEGKFLGGASAAGASVGFNYVFKADGTYASASAGSVSSGSRKSVATASSSSAEGGTYSVSGNQLTLLPAGGKARTHFVHYVPTQAGPRAPDMLIVDSMVITRSK